MCPGPGRLQGEPRLNVGFLELSLSLWWQEAETYLHDNNLTVIGLFPDGLRLMQTLNVLSQF